MRIALIALLLLLAACGEQASTRPAAPSSSPASDAPVVPSPSHAVSSPAAPADGVVVVLTGTPVVAGDGTVEWCPPVIVEPVADAVDRNLRDPDVSGSLGRDSCLGYSGNIPVTGLSAGTIKAFDQSEGWRAEGIYDGGAMRATAEPKPMKLWGYAAPDFTTPCADLRGPSSGASEEPHPLQIDAAAREAVNRYLATIPDRYAAQWWDGANAVLNFLLTGEDLADHRLALEAAVGDRAQVCVVGGARWSYAELDRAQRRASDIAHEEGMGPISNGSNSVANRVELDVTCSDEATVERIKQQTGGAVRVRSFLVVRDATLDDLRARMPASDMATRCARTPVPPHPSEPG
jgi:hypothetical protein